MHRWLYETIIVFAILVGLGVIVSQIAAVPFRSFSVVVVVVTAVFIDLRYFVWDKRDERHHWVLWFKVLSSLISLAAIAVAIAIAVYAPHDLADLLHEWLGIGGVIVAGYVLIRLASFNIKPKTIAEREYDEAMQKEIQNKIDAAGVARPGEAIVRAELSNVRKTTSERESTLSLQCPTCATTYILGENSKLTTTEHVAQLFGEAAAQALTGIAGGPVDLVNLDTEPSDSKNYTVALDVATIRADILSEKPRFWVCGKCDNKSNPHPYSEANVESESAISARRHMTRQNVLGSLEEVWMCRTGGPGFVPLKHGSTQYSATVPIEVPFNELLDWLVAEKGREHLNIHEFEYRNHQFYFQQNSPVSDTRQGYLQGFHVAKVSDSTVRCERFEIFIPEELWSNPGNKQRQLVDELVNYRRDALIDDTGFEGSVVLNPDEIQTHP